MTVCEFPWCSYTLSLAWTVASQCWKLPLRQPEQPCYLHALVKFLMSSIAFVQHWLLLPRLSPRFPVDIRLPNVGPDASCPRLHPNKWDCFQSMYDLINSCYSSDGKLGRGTSLKRLVLDIIGTSSSSLSGGILKCLGLSEHPNSLQLIYILTYILIAWEALDIVSKKWSVDL